MIDYLNIIIFLILSFNLDRGFDRLIQINLEFFLLIGLTHVIFLYVFCLIDFFFYHLTLG